MFPQGYEPVLGGGAVGQKLLLKKDGHREVSDKEGGYGHRSGLGCIHLRKGEVLGTSQDAGVKGLALEEVLLGTCRKQQD